MISYEYPPFGGGIGTACMHLLREFARERRVHVDLITSGPSLGVECITLSDNIEIHKLPIPKKDLQFWRASELAAWTLRALLYSRRLVTERHYDVCHCWAGWPSGVIGHRLRTDVPYIVALRGSDVPGYNPRLHLLDPLVMSHVARRVWRHAARVVALSEDLRALALRTQADVTIDTIPNGVDTNLFRPAGAPQRNNLVFAGRLIERKGVFHLIDALDELSARHPEITLTIAGEGPERPHLEDIVQRRALQARVRFCGHVDQVRLAEIYRSGSIFVLPSSHEALGNVVLEAMASGLAIVTTRTGASELIQDNGIIIESANRLSLTAAIERYLDNPPLLAAHQRRSRSIAEAMSWSGAAARYLDIYDEIAGLRVIEPDGAHSRDRNPSSARLWPF